MDCGHESCAMTKNVPLTNMDILRRIVDFVPPSQFLFFAPVSRSWREAWEKRPKPTSTFPTDSAMSQLAHSFQNSLPRHPYVCSVIALIGHLDLSQQVKQKGCPCDQSTCTGTAEGSHLAALKWASSNGCRWDGCRWDSPFAVK